MPNKLDLICRDSSRGSSIGVSKELAKKMIAKLDAINSNTSEMFDCLNSLLSHQKEFIQEFKDYSKKQSSDSAIESEEERKKKMESREEDRRRRMDEREEDRRRRMDEREEDRKKRLDREEELRQERENKEFEERQKINETHAQKQTKILEDREEMLAQIVKEREEDRKKRLNATSEHSIKLLDERESKRREQEDILFAIQRQEREAKLQYELQREQLLNDRISNKLTHEQLKDMLALQKQVIQMELIAKREEERQKKKEESEKRRKESIDKREAERAEKALERQRLKESKERAQREKQAERLRIRREKEEISKKRKEELHAARVTRAQKVANAKRGTIMGAANSLGSMMSFGSLVGGGATLLGMGTVIMPMLIGIIGNTFEKLFGGNSFYESLKTNLSDAIAKGFDLFVEYFPKWVKFSATKIIPAIGKFLWESIVTFKNMLLHLWKITYGRYVDKWDEELSKFPIYKNIRDFFVKIYKTLDEYILTPLSSLKWDDITKGFEKMIDYIVDIPRKITEYYEDRTLPIRRLMGDPNASVMQDIDARNKAIQTNKTSPVQTYQNPAAPSVLATTPFVQRTESEKEAVKSKKPVLEIFKKKDFGETSNAPVKINKSDAEYFSEKYPNKGLFERAMESIGNFSIFGEAQASTMSDKVAARAQKDIDTILNVNKTPPVSQPSTTMGHTSTVSGVLTNINDTYKPVTPQYPSSPQRQTSIQPLSVPSQIKNSPSVLRVPQTTPDTPPLQQTPQTNTGAVKRNDSTDGSPKRNGKKSFVVNPGDPDKYRSILDTIAAVESTSEGGYNAYNSGTYNDKVVRSGDSRRLLGKALTDMTIDEIMERGAIKDARDPNRIFAAGRYQIIPSTLKGLVKSTKIDTSQKFTPEVQDYLATFKLHERGVIDAINKGDYLLAQNRMAMEWAGMPVATTMVNHKGKVRHAGQSYYSDSVNKANASIAVEAQKALRGEKIDLSRFEGGKKKKNLAHSSPTGSGEGLRFKDGQQTSSFSTAKSGGISNVQGAPVGETKAENSGLSIAQGTLELFKQIRNLSRQPVVVNNSNNVQPPQQSQQQIPHAYSSVNDKEFTKLLVDRAT